ncbi:MAG: SsrA-binding protein SmpB [Phycisphaerales bacterium]|nr:SsrA-binding protein SmpB [Phycisphaerales bacterium]MCB9836767.1 SsrA-binding protein SmpB [Phycisphaera sp.]
MAGKRKKKPGNEAEVHNRRARHDYAIESTLEVGLKLHGTEVKSVRMGEVSIGEAYIRATSEPLSLRIVGMTIGHYGPAASRNHKVARDRVLLAHKSEIKRLARATESKGMTIVPLKLYFHNGYAKLEIGLGKGKGHTDKRRSIADREQKRDIDRAMSKRMKW